MDDRQLVCYTRNGTCSLKALLHYAISSATCLAMVENVALQVAWVGATCLEMLLGTKNKKCAHAPLLKRP